MLPAGASGSTVTVLAEARDGNDGDAVFTVVLLPGTSYTIDPAYASAQAIVRDADPLPVLGFRDLAVTVNEADGTVEFHVDLVSLLPSLRTVTVDYEVSEDRTDDGADLVGTTGTLTFAPGETSAAIEVTVVQDLIAEPNEGFTVSLSNPVYAELQDRQTSLRARGVILDDEPTVTLEVTDTTVDEGADVVVTLTRTGDTSRELTAWLRIVEQGSITYSAVTFSVGFGTATHTITTEDDHEALGTYDLNIGVAHPVNDIGETNTYHRSEGEVTITVGRRSAHRLDRDDGPRRQPRERQSVPASHDPPQDLRRRRDALHPEAATQGARAHHQHGGNGSFQLHHRHAAHHRDNGPGRDIGQDPHPDL